MENKEPKTALNDYCKMNKPIIKKKSPFTLLCRISFMLQPLKNKWQGLLLTLLWYDFLDIQHVEINLETN